MLLFSFNGMMYIEIDSYINRLWEKVVDYYDTRTRLIGNSNFYKFESNKLLTEMLVFLLFKKGKVMGYDNRN